MLVPGPWVRLVSSEFVVLHNHPWDRCSYCVLGPDVLVQMAWEMYSFSLKGEPHITASLLLRSPHSIPWVPRGHCFFSVHKISWEQGQAHLSASMCNDAEIIQMKTHWEREINKTKLPPLGWVKSLNSYGRQYCTFSPGPTWERWAGLSWRRRWTSWERPQTQRWS